MKSKATINDLVCCPHCLNDYGLIEARPCYRHRFKNCDDILFVALCNSCRKEFKPEQHPVDQDALQCISKNLLSNPERWLSATSEVAMVMNGYNFCDALKNGHGLSRAAYEAVKKGYYFKLAYDQPGLVMIWTA